MLPFNPDKRPQPSGAAPAASSAPAQVSPEVLNNLGLTSEEYEQIKGILGRQPNTVELGIFSVMWSEHCSYKNSRKLLKTLPTSKSDPDMKNQVLVKAGEENAGVVDIEDGWSICFKIESHNHPSAVEPFEGAATGVGGILRDIFTMGARPVAFTNSLRFGPLEQDQTRHLLRGVVHGIAHYGNCVGVPNIAGDVAFDPCYEGNPLVNACCVGVLRSDRIQRGKAAGVGNSVYYVGAPTGRDGLGGAAFASKELSETSSEDRPAVQKGDPFMGKLLMEACLELYTIRDKDGNAVNAVVGIQDMGAAGLTCSTCETASRGGMGIEIELDKVPQRETGMSPYEIMLSESQERMLVIVEKGKERFVEQVFEKWDLHAACIGQVTDTGNMVVKHHGEVVADIPAKPLADDAPLYEREAREPEHIAPTQGWDASTQLKPATADQLTEALPRLLAHPTIASKRWVYRQYDHMVGASTWSGPGQGDAAVLRLRLGGAKKDKYIAIANDCNNRYTYANPFEGTKIAVAECLRNLLCTGARPLALTNNLNFGNPYKPDAFWMLKESVRGLAEACNTFDLPVIGGNVSLYNEGPNGPIDPTPVVCVAGIIDHIDKVVGQNVPSGEVSFILVGDVPTHLGQSMFLEVMHGLKLGDAPPVDLEKEAMQTDFMRVQFDKHRILAAHDLSEGGLMVALSEMLFAEGQTYGADIDLRELPMKRLDECLYGESQGHILICCRPQSVDRIVHDAERYGVTADGIGTANKSGTLKVRAPHIDHPLSWDVHTLREGWEGTLPEAMAADAEAAIG
jgi:phosphoribosylformylglycinamidine synthase